MVDSFPVDGYPGTSINDAHALGFVDRLNELVGVANESILHDNTLTELLALGADNGGIVSGKTLALASSGEGLLIADVVNPLTSTWAAASTIPSREFRGAAVSTSLRSLAVAYNSEAEGGVFNVFDNKWQTGFALRVEAASVVTTLGGGGSGTLGIHLNGSQTPGQAALAYTPAAAGFGTFVEFTAPVDATAGEAIGVGTTFTGSPGSVFVTLYVRRLFA